MQCGHCGEKTVFKMVARHKLDRPHANEFLSENVTDVETWELIKCTNCSKPTLFYTNEYLDGYVEYVMSYQMGDEYEPTETKQTQILYPSPSAIDDSIPDSIKKRYKEALDVRYQSPNAFAVMAGRTLETVCSYEGATEGKLIQKINHLAKVERIPKSLAEIAHQLRQIRNLAAHDPENGVTKEDVPIILNFLEVILEYLYVAPAKIEALKKKRLSN